MFSHTSLRKHQTLPPLSRTSFHSCSRHSHRQATTPDDKINKTGVRYSSRPLLKHVCQRAPSTTRRQEVRVGTYLGDGSLCAGYCGTAQLCGSLEAAPLSQTLTLHSFPSPFSHPPTTTPARVHGRAFPYFCLWRRGPHVGQLLAARADGAEGDNLLRLQRAPPVRA